MAMTAQTSFAALTADQRLADFSELVSILQRNYGPLHIKQKTIQLDFAKDVEDYKARIAAARGDAEFYQLLARFLSTLRDAHVSSEVPSTYKATLAFTSDRVEGRILIDKIDRLKLPEELFPVQKGDQLISIGGVPVEKIMAELNEQSNPGNDEGSLRIAASNLTNRREARGFAVPKGITTVSVLPKGAAVPVTVTATWATSGIPFTELDDLGNLTDDDSGALPTAANGRDLLAQLKKLPMFNAMLPQVVLDDMKQAGVSDIGNPKSMFKLPEGAKEIPGLPVTAAIYEVAGKKIGILRIPEYADDSFLEVMARALVVMEQETDALVLDQTNNPGGSVSLVSDIVGLFADKSYVDMNFKVRPSLNWIKKFDDINAKIAEMLAADPNDAAGNALQARFQYLSQELRDTIAQKRFLTTPISLNLTGSFGMIQPNSMVHYTKPVLLLINELDFSGGDAFPAIMKDNGRVTLFGAKTNGAGGNVSEYGPLANSYFKFNLTESLMVRPNGAYIENQGVKPDVAYRVTEDDFMNDYRGYVKAFTVEALKLAGADPAAVEAFKAK